MVYFTLFSMRMFKQTDDFSDAKQADQRQEN